MKIRLTPTAMTQLELIADTMTNETGFIIGQDIGKFRIIENLLPINFNETTIDEVYAKTYSKIGDKLIGVFFNNCEPFLNDWFIENIIIKIKSAQPGFYLYDVNKKLIQLSDDNLEIKKNEM
ncbi:MAG: hypothetical protein JSV88_26040 [Candidatus Aminicenantes bacterium]|nr:MAG: hypothetical protein JSV88_26040 [Candidatus Aminicenantes bacterium]